MPQIPQILKLVEDRTLLEAELHPLMDLLLEALALVVDHNQELLLHQPRTQDLDRVVMLVNRRAILKLGYSQLQRLLLKLHEILPLRLPGQELQTQSRTSTCQHLSTTLMVW